MCGFGRTITNCRVCEKQISRLMPVPVACHLRSKPDPKCPERSKPGVQYDTVKRKTCCRCLGEKIMGFTDAEMAMIIGCDDRNTQVECPDSPDSWTLDDAEHHLRRYENQYPQDHFGRHYHTGDARCCYVPGGPGCSERCTCPRPLIGTSRRRSGCHKRPPRSRVYRRRFVFDQDTFERKLVCEQRRWDCRHWYELRHTDSAREWVRGDVSHDVVWDRFTEDFSDGDYVDSDREDVDPSDDETDDDYEVDAGRDRRTWRWWFRDDDDDEFLPVFTENNDAYIDHYLQCTVEGQLLDIE
ncbi:hypothetical protein Cob_v003301 [Colletotrichum orbiculare MAFF 240422]|uniref:Uncharacterized protein n=1 Tax=Colletotrichum orbiculare (strain 104-T / ATCC 96160 / CBS 514.97 / LARS 414 / MAFF 240422) TaxID=1213857 RepID=N4W181_COLOR|nr:hypothetical protein Cob_v003301 [Colletotrichum orbiculare MAFF 240422]